MIENNLNQTIQAERIPRRHFLQLFAAGSVAALGFPKIASASMKYSFVKARELKFNNLHTDEKLTIPYFEEGQYIPEALKEISYILRDHRTDDVLDIDPNLLNFLYQLQTTLETSKPIGIISGYRSPKTNAALRSRSGRVARTSKHMLGKAIDIRIEKISCRNIRNAAISLRQGGVGYYRRSNFVHLDTGTFRHW
ncbi:MAG: YcbK family protein [Methylococcales bacterium]|nr:YcbK family protein [Methylococcales bacterium]